MHLSRWLLVICTLLVSVGSQSSAAQVQSKWREIGAVLAANFDATNGLPVLVGADPRCTYVPLCEDSVDDLMIMRGLVDGVAAALEVPVHREGNPSTRCSWSPGSDEGRIGLWVQVGAIELSPDSVQIFVNERMWEPSASV